MVATEMAKETEKPEEGTKKFGEREKKPREAKKEAESKEINGTKIGGEITLVGFEALQPMELIVAKKIIGNHVKELTEKTDYKSLKLQLRIHHKGESNLYELAAQSNIGNKMFGSKAEKWNLYEAINDTMGNILAEAMHKHRTAEEIGKERIREQRRKERAEKNL